MLEPWNNKSLLPPPLNTSQCNENVNVAITTLRYTCSTIINVLSKQSPLHKESAIFSRFVYKFDKKFRNDKGYKYFKKVNSGLRKYLNFTMIKDTETFMSMLPEKGDTSYIPTRQMLEFILIRLMTFSKLMYRISLCSKQAAIFYLDRIKRGESHWMSLMPYALLSRVWSMGLVLLQHSCNWYKQLYSCLNELTIKGVHFLPDKFVLPFDLEEWVDIKQLKDAHLFAWSTKSTISCDSLIEEDNEGDLCENILKYAENINKNQDQSIIEPDLQFKLPKYEEYIPESSVKKFDEGEKISRESFKVISKESPTILTNPISKVREDHSLKNVSDRNSLNKFIENEETFRNQSDINSLTGHLSFMQWQALKNALLKLEKLYNSVNKRKLERKLHKIWEEKCLAYV